MRKRLLATLILCLPLQALAEEYITIEAPTARVWSEWTSNSDANVMRLVETLQRSSTGRRLIEGAISKAREHGLSLTDLVKPGEGSLTDTTLIRKFHPDTPENVVYETRSLVYVNRHLGMREALMDLAHELTHYLHREPFNPYTLNFSLADFVRSTIEGEGGEAHAFVVECQVMRELFTKEFSDNANCSAIEGANGHAREEAVRLFYHVGNFLPQAKQLLTAEQFPHLAKEKIKFVSSAYGMPYPLAAIEEYRSVLGKVCENDRRRLAYMGKTQGRSPASVAKLRSQVEQRCSTIAQN